MGSSDKPIVWDFSGKLGDFTTDIKCLWRLPQVHETIAPCSAKGCPFHASETKRNVNGGQLMMDKTDDLKDLGQAINKRFQPKEVECSNGGLVPLDDGGFVACGNTRCPYGGSIKCNYKLDSKDKMPTLLNVNVRKANGSSEVFTSLDKFTLKFEFCVGGEVCASYRLGSIIFYNGNHFRLIVLDAQEGGDMNIIYEGVGLGGPNRIDWVKYHAPFSNVFDMKSYRVLEVWYVKVDASLEIKHHESLSRLHNNINISSILKSEESLRESSWIFGKMTRSDKVVELKDATFDKKSLEDLQSNPQLLENPQCYGGNGAKHR